MDTADSFYLPMDCPNCGRARLLVYPADQVMECEKCGASAYECSGDDHERGGAHPQTASDFFRHSQRPAAPVPPKEQTEHGRG